MPVTYTDNSQMPFGKHQGKRLIDVPAYYLLWLWENQYDSKADEAKPVSVYIFDNLDVLKSQVKR